MEKKGHVLMGKYEFNGFLGQGTFAKVYRATNLETDQSVAIKVINKDKVVRGGLVAQTKREIDIMRMLKHPNIVELYEVMVSENKIYLIMEYAKGGELFQKIAKGKLEEKVAWNYFQQLITAVDFCHNEGVYHRDLKPENLLLDENGVLKVSDFGLSALAESKRQDGLLHTYCGTPCYTAPEILMYKAYDGIKADIWSCGVILFALLAGYLPFPRDPNLSYMCRKICTAEYKCPRWFSNEVRSLLSRILNPNPDKRMLTSEIVNSCWFKRCNSKAIANENVTTIEDSKDCKKAELANSADLISFNFTALSSGLDLPGLFKICLLRIASACGPELQTSVSRDQSSEVQM